MGGGGAGGGGSGDGTPSARRPSESASSESESGDGGGDASERFRAASGWVQERPRAVSDALPRDRKLRLYGLYKRVAVGPLPEEHAGEGGQGHGEKEKAASLLRPPSWANLKARAKERAWAEASSLPLAEAQREYAALVEKELGWRPHQELQAPSPSSSAGAAGAAAVGGAAAGG